MKYVDYVTNGSGSKKGDIMEGTASAIFGMDSSEDTDDFMELPLDDIISKEGQIQPTQDQSTQPTQTSQQSQMPFNGIGVNGYNADATKFGNVASNNANSNSGNGIFGSGVGGTQFNTQLGFGTAGFSAPSSSVTNSDTSNRNDGFDDDDDVDKFFGDDEPIEQPPVENPIMFHNTFAGSKGGQFYKAASNFVLNHQSDKNSTSSTTTMENTLMALLQRMIPSQQPQQTQPPQPSFSSIPQPLTSSSPIQQTSTTQTQTHQPQKSQQPTTTTATQPQNNQNYNRIIAINTHNSKTQPKNPNTDSNPNQITPNYPISEENQSASFQKEQDALEQILKGVKTSTPSATSSVSTTGTNDVSSNQLQKGNEYNLNEQLQELGFISQGGNSTTPSTMGGEVKVDLPKMPESTDVSFIDPAIVVVSTSENDHEKGEKKLNIIKNENTRCKGISQIKIERPSIQNQNQNVGGKEKESDHRKEGSGIKIQRPGNSSQNNTLGKEEKKSGNGKRRNKKQAQNADEKETVDENGQKRKLRIIRKSNETKSEVKSEWKTLEATKPFSQILLEDSSKK